MKTSLYLDKRFTPTTAPDEEPTYPVKISISSKQKTAYIGTGIRLPESGWSQSGSNAKKASIRIKLEEKKLAVERVLEDLRTEGRLHGLDVREIKELAVERLRTTEEGNRHIEKTVLECFAEFIKGKTRPGTIGVYQSTVRRLLAFKKFKNNFTFQDITSSWLRDFDAFLAETAPSANARGIHLRNIKAVFNDALKKKYTTADYSFSNFKIIVSPTKDRSLTPEELRSFFSEPCSEIQKKYRDIFLLSFLCCGINLEDLLTQKELKGGRIETTRIKTGQPLSIKVPDEAREIIERYRGKQYLLDILERCTYKNYVHRINDALKTIGLHYNKSSKKWEGKALQPEISYYWARYSWATIAAELDIPERTIGAALGHSTAKTVTSIYTRVDMRKKTDIANRKVIDYVFTKESL